MWARRYLLTYMACGLLGFTFPYALAQQSPTSPGPGNQVQTPPTNVGNQQGGNQSNLGISNPRGGGGRGGGGRGGGRGGRGGASASASATTPDASQNQPSIDQGSRSAGGASRSGGSGVRSVSASARRAPASIGEQDWQPALDHDVPISVVPDEGQSISINGFAAPIPIIEVLDQLQLATGWSIVSSPGVEEVAVRFWAENLSPANVLKILRENGIYYEHEAETNFLYVMLDEEYLDREYGELTPAEFLVKHADVIDMESQLRALMSPVGKMIPDPRTGRILVWDTLDNLEAMNDAIDLLDIPLEPAVYEIQYGSADALLDSVSTFLSERGIAHADPITNQIIVSDSPTRQSQIAKMLETLDTKLPHRTWTLSYADPDELAERLEGVLPEETSIITTDEATHQVTAIATAARIEQIDSLVAEWDVPREQVEISAYLVTAGADVMRRFGVDWSYFTTISGMPFSLQRGDSSPNYRAAGPDAGQRANVGRLPYRQFMRDPITGALTTFLTDEDGNEASSGGNEFVLDPGFYGDKVGVVLDYLDQNDDLDILARPRVTVQDGEEAVFQRIQQEAFQSFGFNNGGVVNNNNDNNINVNRVSPGRVEFVEVGIVLKVLPRINMEGKILLEIEAEDSAADEQVLVSAGLESTVPEKIEAKVETEVLVQSGDTIVIGGLRANSFSNTVDRMPLLGDIPLLGKIFRKTSRENQEREFIVFITPTIRNEFTQPEADRLASFDEDAKDSMRHAQKNIWGRANDKMTRGENELGVSIGQSNNLFSEGRRLNFGELLERFKTASEGKSKTTIVLRVHPDASNELVDQIIESAEGAGLEVDIEDSLPPLVPTFPPGWEKREIPGE